MMVPAVTISPSWNFMRAKFFASVSVSNVLVDRWLRRRTNVPPLGKSKVTYQVGVIFKGIGRQAPFLRISSGRISVRPNAAVL
jgi:hypothetical protein